MDHGKTTLTEKLSGKWTDTHSEEIKRGITIRLGYADATLCRCPECEGDKAYVAQTKCPCCGSETEVLRKVSFIDAPGHESLMATMLSGAAIMDGALLLVAANEECPQPQTMEHLMALNIIGIDNIIIVQNKIDLVKKDQAIKNYNQIREFLKGTKYENAPIIPVSAQHGANIDLLIKQIQESFPTPKRNLKARPTMFVARSFDVNKPGMQAKDLIGGILGGALKEGIFKLGDEIEIRPGTSSEVKNQKIYTPLRTKIVGLMTGGAKVEQVGPGGSVAVLTELDPSIVKSDQLTGSVVGLPGFVPPVWHKFRLGITLLDRVVGAKDKLVVENIKMHEAFMLNVNSSATVGVVTQLSKDKVEFVLKIPVCAEVGSRVTISRRIGNRWRLIGYGIIQE